MWSSLLGALAITGMALFGTVLLPGAPKLIDAISARIRHGVQPPHHHDSDEETEADEESGPAAPITAVTSGRTAA